MGRLGLLEVIKGVAPPKIYEIPVVDMTGIPEPTSLSTVSVEPRVRTGGLISLVRIDRPSSVNPSSLLHRDETDTISALRSRFVACAGPVPTRLGLSSVLYPAILSGSLHAQSDEIYRKEEARIRPHAARCKSDARQHRLARPPTPIGDVLC